MRRLTRRELEVVGAVRQGAHTLEAIAGALEPPISRRGAERLVESISSKVPPEVSPVRFLRVVLFAYGVDVGDRTDFPRERGPP